MVRTLAFVVFDFLYTRGGDPKDHRTSIGAGVFLALRSGIGSLNMDRTDPKKNPASLARSLQIAYRPMLLWCHSPRGDPRGLMSVFYFWILSVKTDIAIACKQALVAFGFKRIEDPVVIFEARKNLYLCPEDYFEAFQFFDIRNNVYVNVGLRKNYTGKVILEYSYSLDKYLFGRNIFYNFHMRINCIDDMAGFLESLRGQDYVDVSTLTKRFEDDDMHPWLMACWRYIGSMSPL